MKQSVKIVLSFGLIMVLVMLFFVGCRIENPKTEKKSQNLYTITTKANNNSYGSVVGAGTYLENENITIYASPKNGYIFKKWNDDSRENPRIVNVNGNKSYTAYFEIKKRYALIESIQIELNHDYGGWDILENGEKIICNEWGVELNGLAGSQEIHGVSYFTSAGTDEILREKTSTGEYIDYKLIGCRTVFGGQNNNKLEIGKNVNRQIGLIVKFTIAGIEQKQKVLHFLDPNIIFNEFEEQKEIVFDYPNYGKVNLKFIYSVIR